MDTNTLSPTPHSGRMVRFFSNPMVGVLGSVSSVIGVLLAVYFYWMSLQFPELLYQVHPVAVAVVDQHQVSDLSVSFGGKEIKSDVTAAQVAFWNQGRQAITDGDVLSPLTISTVGGVPILRASIAKKSRDIVSVSVDKVGLENGEAKIDWNILEKNDGAIVQLIFAGPIDTRIVARAIVRGQESIVEDKPSQTIKSPREEYEQKYKQSRIPGFAMLGMGVLLGVFFVILMVFFRQRGRLFETIHWIMVVNCALAVGAGIMALYKSVPPGPPFGW